jgi:hypothetical protein
MDIPILRSLSPENKKFTKPLRSLRLCGESIHLIENPDTNLTAQLEIYSAPIDLRQVCPKSAKGRISST